MAEDDDSPFDLFSPGVPQRPTSAPPPRSKGTPSPQSKGPLHITADFFEDADPRWLRGVARGLLCMGLSIPGHVLGAIFKWQGMVATKGITHLVAALFLFYGVYMATRKEPVVTFKPTALTAWAPPPPVKASPLVIWTRMFALVALVLWLLLGLLATDIWTDYGYRDPLVLLVLVIQAVLAILFAPYAANLARRIPDDALISHAHYTGWLTAIVCGFLFIILGTQMNKGPFPFFFMFSYPLIAGWLAVLLWATITLLRMGQEIRAAAWKR